LMTTINEVPEVKKRLVIDPREMANEVEDLTASLTIESTLHHCGISAKELESHDVSERKIERAFEGMKKFPKLVKKTATQLPLDRITFLSIPDNESGGAYRNGSIRLNTLANKVWEVADWKPGESSHIVQALGPEEILTGLMVHEMGHHYDDRVLQSSPELRGMAFEAGARALFDERFITHYAANDPFEWFAECFAAYHYFPQDLKAFDSMAFELVRRVMSHKIVTD
jgi:hypothetical protein